jgi:hypothetical protein
MSSTKKQGEVDVSKTLREKHSLVMHVKQQRSCT